MTRRVTLKEAVPALEVFDLRGTTIEFRGKHAETGRPLHEAVRVTVPWFGVGPSVNLPAGAAVEVLGADDWTHREGHRVRHDVVGVLEVPDAAGAKRRAGNLWDGRCFRTAPVSRSEKAT